jgi:hypothetical protein
MLAEVQSGKFGIDRDASIYLMCLGNSAECEWHNQHASGLAIVVQPVEAFVEAQLTIAKHGAGVGGDAHAHGHDAPSEAKAL